MYCGNIMGLLSTDCKICGNNIKDAFSITCNGCGLELHSECAKSKGFLKEGATKSGGLLSSAKTQYHWDCPKCSHTATKAVKH